MVSIGIDLGGTNIAVGAVSEEGALLSQVCVPTRSQRPYQDVVREMAACVREALQKAQLPETALRSIGIGVPGAVDPVQGTVIGCSNIPWHGVPLRSEMQRYFSVPVFLENDATVAALAETVCGAAKGAGSCVMLTLGTGVGSGIILNGRPWNGAFRQGGEIGHMVLYPNGVPCACGRNGCVERYCSATALALRGKQACWAHPDSLILKKAGGDIEGITARMVMDAAKEGDAPALRAVSAFADALALTIDNIINFLDPEIIVLGGGVSRAGAFLLDAVLPRIPTTDRLDPRTLPSIVLAQLGSEAGVIGAAMLQ